MVVHQPEAVVAGAAYSETGHADASDPCGQDDAEDWRRRLRGGKVLRDGHVLAWWLELLVLGVLYVTYEGIRDFTNGGKFEAFDNAIRVMDFQKATGINWELDIQRWALDFKVLIISSNYFYGSLYVIVTLGVLIWLYRKHPNSYPLWRNALLVTTLLGLVGFSMFPLMPPRLLSTMRGDNAFRFRDTLEMYPAFWSFGSGTMKSISNQYAAMPSLHCAWALWCTSALVPRLRTWWSRTLAVLYTAGTVFVVVVSGNHYFIDAIAGFVIVAIGYALSRLCTRAGRGAPAQSTEVIDVAARGSAQPVPS